MRQKSVRMIVCFSVVDGVHRDAVSASVTPSHDAAGHSHIEMERIVGIKGAVAPAHPDVVDAWFVPNVTRDDLVNRAVARRDREQTAELGVREGLGDVVIATRELLGPRASGATASSQASALTPMPPADPPMPPADPPMPPADSADAASRPADAAGRSADPAGRSADPAGRPADPAGRPADPPGRSADPAGRSADPPGRSADPAGRSAKPFDVGRRISARPASDPVLSDLSVRRRPGRCSCTASGHSSPADRKAGRRACR